MGTNPHKPRIKLGPLGAFWACGCLNGHGKWTYTTGDTPLEAYLSWQSYLESLHVRGLFWEVFP